MTKSETNQPHNAHNNLEIEHAVISGLNFEQILATFSGFLAIPLLKPPEHSSNPGNKRIQHPPSRGIPCYQPLGPTFINPESSMSGWEEGAHVRMCACHMNARANLLWGPLPRSPGSHGLTTWHPPTGRVLNLFPALVCPSPQVLGMGPGHFKLAAMSQKALKMSHFGTIAELTTTGARGGRRGFLRYGSNHLRMGRVQPAVPPLTMKALAIDPPLISGASLPKSGGRTGSQAKVRPPRTLARGNTTKTAKMAQSTT